MPARLLYTGQVVVDLVMGLDALPLSGGDVLAHSARFEVGGGFNVMAAARRHGLATLYLGRHGQGRFGDMARQAMADEGIDAQSVMTEGQDTGLSVALIEPSAERTFISHVGAEGEIALADLRRVEVREGDFVFVSGYSLSHPRKAGLLLEWLDEVRVPVTLVFDPGPLVLQADDPLMARLLPRIGLWTSNREETLRFTGRQGIDEALADLRHVLPQRSLVVVRDGPNGCWLSQGEEVTRVPGYPVQAVDTNGAGDAHAGVLLASLAAGYSSTEAARRANAAAAIAVTRWGPATCPGVEEVEALMAGERR